MVTEEAIEKHYYAQRNDPVTFALATSRATRAADLGYRSRAHNHPYEDGNAPCNKGCRVGRPTEPTMPPQSTDEDDE